MSNLRMVLVDDLEMHRAAYATVMAGIPGSVFLSHEVNLEPGWDTSGVHFPPLVQLGPVTGCKTCGDSLADMPLTQKCKDLHERCHCGARYDEPKNPGCRRRKHPKPEPKDEP